MQYTSTRGDSTSRKFMDVLKMGLAPDGGLFMPTSFPHIDLVAYKKLSYRDLAAKIIHLFAPEVNFGLVCAMCNLAYTKEAFGSDEITPLVQLDKHTSLLKLSQGPTLAFKDVAMRLVAQFMDMAQGEEQRVLNVVGATSGDTGSAAIHALMGKEFLQVFMLSPKDRMSPFQQQQMYTVDDPHIHNLVVDGPFDDCQNMVKAVFGDPGFKKLHNLGAVNSINWARIVAQVVYYAYGYFRAAQYIGQHVAFAVPSGNFGNAFAGFVAQQMGLPIRLIVATNTNDVLDEFFRTGIYRVRKGSNVAVTSSPSMDIAEASNFERFAYLAVNKDAEKLRGLWRQLRQLGQIDLGASMSDMDHKIRSGSATDLQVVEAIRTAYRKWDIVIDPHTAVAMHVGLAKRLPTEKLVVLETAQPAKFAATIFEALGFNPPVPAGCEHLAQKKQHVMQIRRHPDALKHYIEAHA